MTPDLLTLTELAERWRVPIATAKAIVRRKAVPFIRLSPSNLRVVWGSVRFDSEVIKAWENEHNTMYVPPAERVVESVKAARVSRLGNWRA